MSRIGKRLEAGSGKLERSHTSQELLILRRQRMRLLVIAMAMSCWFWTGAFAGEVYAIDGDVVFKRTGSERETPLAVFPHWSHRIRYRCYACHPGLFKMQAGGDTITMDEIMAGKSCGTCHNGTIAWPVSFETCNRCHTPKQE